MPFLPFLRGCKTFKYKTHKRNIQVPSHHPCNVTNKSERGEKYHFCRHLSTGTATISGRDPFKIKYPKFVLGFVSFEFLNVVIAQITLLSVSRLFFRSSCLLNFSSFSSFSGRWRWEMTRPWASADASQGTTTALWRTPRRKASTTTLAAFRIRWRTGFWVTWSGRMK